MTRSGKTRKLLAGCLVLLLVASVVTGTSLFAAGPANAQSPTTIDSCTTITEPGTYVLTQDVTNSSETVCIDVQASDVVIDGDGHTIDGIDGSETTAVSIESQSNVTVKNLVLSEWRIGTKLDSTTNSTVSNVVVTDTLRGVYLSESDANTLRNVSVTDSGSGITLFRSQQNHLTDIVSSDNANGISIAYRTADNRLRNVSTNDNSYTGIQLSNIATNNSLSNVTANNNTNGIGLADSDDNHLTNIAVRNNDRVGVQFVGSDNNTLTRSVIAGNDVGITIDNTGIPRSFGSTENLVYDNRLNNTRNVVFGFQFANFRNSWNVSKRPGPNVIGGPSVGGNYYATPDSTGYSQTCTDSDDDGFCDSPNDFGVSGNDNNTDFLPLASPVDISVSPSIVDFGTRIAPGDTATANVTIKNTGSTTLDVTDISIGGPNASSYIIVDGVEPVRLEPGESQRVQVEFAPTSDGTKQATLTVASNDTDAPVVTVALRGSSQGC